MRITGKRAGREDPHTHVRACRRLSNIPLVRVGRVATLRVLLKSRLPVFRGRRLVPVEYLADENLTFPRRFPNPAAAGCKLGEDIFLGWKRWAIVTGDTSTLKTHILFPPVTSSREQTCTSNLFHVESAGEEVLRIRNICKQGTNGRRKVVGYSRSTNGYVFA